MEYLNEKPHLNYLFDMFDANQSMSILDYRAVVDTYSPNVLYFQAIQPTHLTAQMHRIQFQFLYESMVDCRLSFVVHATIQFKDLAYTN